MQKLQFTNVCNLIFIISSVSYLTQCQLLFVLCNLSIFLNAIGTYICLRTECLLCTITKNKERSVYTFIFMPHFPNWVSYLVKENNLTKEKGNLISKYLLRLNRIQSFFRDMSYTVIHSRFGMRKCRLCMFNKCFPIHYNQFLWLYGIRMRMVK